MGILDDLDFLDPFDSVLRDVRPSLPPHEVSANTTAAWLILTWLAVELAIGLWVMTRWSRRDPARFPMPLIAAVLGAGVLFTFCEAPGDWIIGIWYPHDTPLIAFTMLQRPIPLWIVLLWLGIVPFSTIIGYRLVITGAPIRKFVLVAGGLGVVEIAQEMLMSQFGVITYYGNYPKLFGVPYQSVVQNGFMYMAIGVALAYVVPRVRGWQWLLVPSVPVATFMVYGAASYTPTLVGAAHHDTHPWLNVAGTTLSVVLNITLAIACLYTRTAKEFREQAARQSSGIPDVSAAPETRPGARVRLPQ